MGTATGLGLLEVAILEACEASGAAVGSFVKARTVLDTLQQRTGIGPRVAYEPLCDLARPWALNLSLLEFHGNSGSPDDPPASARYTECCLSRLGAAALAAERGEIGPLPIGLINGTTHVDGYRPPLDPSRVVAAIRAVAGGEVSDGDIVGIVGQPSFPTGCDVKGDLALLASGEEVDLVLSARVDQEGDELVISHLPPDSSSEQVLESLLRLVHRRDGRDSGSGPVADRFRIREVRNETTSRTGTRIVVAFEATAEVPGVTAALFDLWPVRRSLVAGFGQPLATLVRDAAAHREGLPERLGMIESATRL